MATIASASRALSGLARWHRPPLPAAADPRTAARRRQEEVGGIRPLSAATTFDPARWRWRQWQWRPQRRSLSDDLKRRAIDALKSGGAAEATAGDVGGDVADDDEADADAYADDGDRAGVDPGTFRNAGGVGKFGAGGGSKGIDSEVDGGAAEEVAVPEPDAGAAEPAAATDSGADEATAADSEDDSEDDSAAAEDSAAVAEPNPFAAAGVHLHEFAPKIVVAGVGGAGTNAVNNMVSSGLAGVEFLALNTDAQHLSSSLSPTRLQIGTQLTSGLGCGANPDAGRLAAEESSEAIQSCIEDAHMVFITAGMGGGTGTGAAPVVAGLCYDLGILTVSVVTTPFRFEGTHRRRLALEGIDRLKQVSDTLICVPNQNLFNLAGEDTSFVDAFKLADDVLLAGVRSVTDLMTSPGLINLDFADVQSVMHGMGNALLGTGQACRDDDVAGVGEDLECRAVRAARMALNNPLLGEGDADVGSAKGMLVNMSGGSDMTLREVDRAAAYVTERVLDPDANIIFGSAYDASLTGCVRVSVVATGIEEGKNE